MMLLVKSVRDTFWRLGALGLAAMLTIAPASAQYLVTITGTGTYTPCECADPTPILDRYGRDITYSATFELTSGVDYSEYSGDPVYISYSGKTLSASINGNMLPLAGPNPDAELLIVDGPSSRRGLISVASYTFGGPSNPPDFEYTLLAFDFVPPTINGNEIPSDFPFGPVRLFSILAVQQYAVYVPYTFATTAFSVTGAMPPITKFDPPPNPPLPTVPEPSSWLALLLGFALSGWTLRAVRGFRHVPGTA